MSNAIHHGHDDGSHATTCGASSYDKRDDRSAVTCRRCLASLAKRDRAFQRKARSGIAGGAMSPEWYARAGQLAAARAIAREEGLV